MRTPFRLIDAEPRVGASANEMVRRSKEKYFSSSCRGSPQPIFDSKLVDRVKRLAEAKTTRGAVRVALEHSSLVATTRKCLHCAAREAIKRPTIRRPQAICGDARCSSALRCGSQTHAVTIWSRLTCSPQRSRRENPSGLPRRSCRRFCRAPTALIGSAVGIGCQASCRLLLHATAVRLRAARRTGARIVDGPAPLDGPRKIV